MTQNSDHFENPERKDGLRKTKGRFRIRNHPRCLEMCRPYLPYLPFFLLSLAALWQLYGVFVLRMTYPLDLEWMEGGTLVHALRIMDGRPVYAEPSVEFVSFLYTPLYPAVLAFLGRVFGLGYFLGRLVSVISFTVACVFCFLWVRSAAGVYDDVRLKPLAACAGLAACAVAAMAYPFCGAWYDLVRADSLWLAFVVGGCYMVRPGGLKKSTHKAVRVAVGAVLLTAAVFTKQTAAPFIVAATVGMALTTPWKMTILFAGVCTTLVSGLVFLGEHLTDGWFWIYVYRLHQSHEFLWERVWPETPGTLMAWGFPVFALVAWWPVAALMKRWVSKDALFVFLLAGCGFAVAVVGSATQGAYDNAYIPAVFFGALMAAVGVVDAAGMFGGGRRDPSAGYRLLSPGAWRLRKKAVDESDENNPGKGFSQNGLSWIGPVLGLAGLGILSAQVISTWFAPAPAVPSVEQVNASRRFVSYLKSWGPNVFVPYHPYYNVIAGGRGHLHVMGINDAYAWARYITGDPERDKRIKARFMENLRRSFAEQRWSVVIHDRTFTHQFPGMTRAYRRVDDLGERAPGMLTGNECRPRYIWVPR